jgi:hypothetical protein
MNHSPYDVLDIDRDVNQDDVRRRYLYLREQLTGDELKNAQEAWEQLWSPNHRLLTDALLLQSTAPSDAEIFTELSSLSDAPEDWLVHIKPSQILQHDIVRLNKVILETVWLEQDLSRLFPRTLPSSVSAETTPSRLMPRDSANSLQQRQTSITQQPEQRSTAPDQRNLYRTALIQVSVNIIRKLWNRRSLGTLAALALIIILLSFSIRFVQSWYGSQPDIDSLPASVIPENIDTQDASDSDLHLATEEGASSADITSPKEETGEAVDLLDISIANNGVDSGGSSDDNRSITPGVESSESPLVRTRTYVNMREGPGQQYPIIVILEPGQEQRIIAKNSTETWWQIELSATQTGWVSAQVVTVIGDIRKTPIADPTP